MSAAKKENQGMRRKLAAEGVDETKSVFVDDFNDAVTILTKEVGPVVAGPLADWMQEHARAEVAREEAQVNREYELRVRVQELEEARA